MWPTGIASEEDIHGAAQLLMRSISKIRAAFTFRRKFRLSFQVVRLRKKNIQTVQWENYLTRPLSREAAHQLLVKASDIAKPNDKKRGRSEKAAKRDPDFVCVHIRRLVTRDTRFEIIV